MYPLLKTGGLADVTGALPKAQLKQKAEARVLLPGFPAVKDKMGPTDLVAVIDTFAGRAALSFGYFDGVGVYVIDAPHLFHREGSPYHDEYQNAYQDNYLRFGLLGWIGADLTRGLDSMWRPDIIHAHDWHAGLACAYLAEMDSHERTKSVFTIHNLAYQGCFAPIHMAQLHLPWYLYNMNGLEYYGQISFMKAGIFFADHVTTVSPTYAREILGPENGFGMQGLLSLRASQGRLTGILNGIDDVVWDPKTDPLIPQNFDKRTLNARLADKEALQKEFHLEVTNSKPLFGVVSRLVHQKGLDLVLEALPFIMEQGGQFVLLGSGEQWLERGFEDFAHNNPAYRGNVAVRLGYDDALSHRITAGSDVLMVPSRFEPCGLTQMAALRYGSLPLVHNTGGLADTVVNSTVENVDNKTATGFIFYDCNRDALQGAVSRAMELWKSRKTWRTIQQRAMTRNFGWKESARQYLDIYRKLL
jgi:starch synthase